MGELLACFQAETIPLGENLLLLKQILLGNHPLQVWQAPSACCGLLLTLWPQRVSDEGTGPICQLKQAHPADI